MPQTISPKVDLLAGRITLKRHYFTADIDPAYQEQWIAQQVGSLSSYTQINDQMRYNSYGYYNQADGSNKFDRRVIWNMYGSQDLMPSNRPANAYTYSPNGAGEIHIHCLWEDPAKAPAITTGALSHEMGHAWHYWSGLWMGNPLLRGLEEWFEKQFSSNHTAFGNYAPWLKSSGTYETGAEQFANAFRDKFGTLDEREGPADPVLPGFEDPRNHPEWKKSFLITPELCAMGKVYGITNVSWQGGIDGQFWFQTTQTIGNVSTGTWIALTSYNAWYKYVWTGSKYDWIAFSPSYTLP